MTISETDKLSLETLNAGPDLYPSSFNGFEVSQEIVQSELMTLQQSNEQLHEQVAALRARNEELESYTRGVTHNLKNPLSVILMAADAIHKIGDLSREEVGEYLRQIRFTAYEMDNIIEKFLLFSELRNADVPVSPINMADVVEHICMRMRYLIRDRRAQIRLPEKWPTALGYAPWIEEVWVNYLSNALQYGGQPPKVEFGAFPQNDGMLRFWVRDNGLGLSKEMQSHLFMPFAQFSRVYRNGHGLGLSIVRSIIEKLGGEVGVESELKHGSLFFFSLPAYSAEAESILDGKV
jgi:two-component system, sensor histidine kinase and response regulator